MNKIILTLMLFYTSSVFAFEAYSFGLIFGSTTLKKEGHERTYGSGLTLRLELFEDEDWGYIASAGTNQTEGDELVGTNEPEFKFNSIILNAGAFKYFYEYFRIAGGLTYMKIDEKQATISGTDEFTYNKLGLFSEVGIKYPMQNIVLGINYIYQTADNFEQSGVYLLFGLRI